MATGPMGGVGMTYADSYIRAGGGGSPGDYSSGGGGECSVSEGCVCHKVRLEGRCDQERAVFHFLCLVITIPQHL
jgi:hypothetical protein